ncbi:MAG: hypothetical protein SFU99_24245 [Saprospiraceae bacterium]|nr:hypothetical protein [Saprospiraceae bacterium]
MSKILLILVSSLLLLTSAAAQEVLTPGQNYYEENKGIVYNKEFSVNFKLHTNGYALGVDIGSLQTYYITRFWTFEIGELKHPKEFRQGFDSRSSYTNRIARAFIFGKENTFIPLRVGFGEKRYLSEKAKRRGLAIGMSYAIGGSLGLLKPYYLDIVRYPDVGGGDPFVRSERYSEENAEFFLNTSRIYGSSGFAKGLDEISFLPGAHGKFAIHFDWGAFDEFVKALDAGVMVDFYFKDVPIMVESPRVANAENTPIFINLYLNLQLGKRW